MTLAIEPRVRLAVADSIGFDLEQVKLSHALVADLGCDELDSIFILMSLEDEFQIEIDDEKFAECVTVQDLVRLVSE